MFVILDKGELINTRHIAAILPMPPAGYPATADPRFIVHMATPGVDLMIGLDDYKEILGAVT